MLSWPGDELPEAVAAATGPGGPWEIVDEDVLGARMPVFRQRPRSVLDLLRGGAERFAERPYVVFPDRTITFGAMPAAAAAVARSLQAEYGVGPGDRVAIVSANRAEYALTFWAVTALGAMTAAFNGWWTGTEMAYALELTEPAVVLGDERRLDRLGPATSAPIVSFDRDFAALEAAGAGAALPDVALDEDDPFLILFTSGTTGRPKGAMISHRGNIHFAMSSQLRGYEMRVRSGADLTVAPAFPPCSIGAAPMFHIAGMNAGLVLAPSTGSTIVYPPPGRWSEDVHLQLTERHRATSWSLVPTQLWRLLDHPDLDKYDLSSVATVGGGSAVWPPELLRRLQERLPGVRAGLGLGFGMTETNGLGTSLTGPDTHTRPDSIGVPGPGVQVEVRDPATRSPLPDGEVGEIALRTAACFLGYWRNDEATAAALDDDLWYHTGDFGHIRDGYVYLEGRRQDLIIRGGENIYPAEIENRIIEHPAVAEVAVVGIEHATLGEEVKAYVVLHDGQPLTAAEVQEWCRLVLAGFKAPSVVEFVPDLPHNASGKVMKHVLRQPGTSGGFVPE